METTQIHQIGQVRPFFFFFFFFFLKKNVIFCKRGPPASTDSMVTGVLLACWTDKGTIRSGLACQPECLGVLMSNQIRELYFFK